MDDVVARGMRGELRPGTPDFELFIDRTARRPQGEEATAHYRVAAEHQSDFDLAIAELELTRADRYLEVGFGGGQLLERALALAGSAAGIDHSPDMLALASERNVRAVVDGRLQLVYGDARHLPWPDGSFTVAAAVNMFFFLDEPATTLGELHRVLARGGRLVVVTVPPEHPESGPWLSAMHVYASDDLKAMIERAGFSGVDVHIAGRRQVARARKRG